VATTVATLTVCDFSSTVRVVLPTLEGKGRPGAFLTGAFLAGAFLATAFFTGAFFAGAFFANAFFAGAFFATFFVTFFATFLAGALLAGAFLATAFFFAGTPRTLCSFTAKTNFATQIHSNFLPNYSTFACTISKTSGR
jgi:uncharacterized protein YjbI with pentapeptide repeats